MKLTKNQQLLLRIAEQGNGEWVDISGVCMNGQFSGRGRATVISSLEKKGLIEFRLRVLKGNSYSHCIRTVKPAAETGRTSADKA